MKPKIILTLLFILTVFISSLLLNDLEISKSLYNHGNSFAIFIQQYGELPGVFVLIFASIIWGFNIKSYRNNFRQFVKIFSSIILASLIAYSGYMIFFYTSNTIIFWIQHQYTIIITWSVLILIIYLFESRINFNSSVKIKTFSKTALMTGIIGYCLFIEPFKIFWGRIRFRDLDILYNNFSVWYLPHGFSGNQSFPSGHAAMGFMLLPLVILVWDKRPVIKSLVISVICMWGVLVCLSRIVIGAHYATDVLFGSAGIIISFLISLITFKKDLVGLSRE